MIVFEKFLLSFLFLVQTCLNSPIMDYFNEDISPSVTAQEQEIPEPDFIPEINGGVMTEFFQTYSIIGEDTSSSEEQRGEEDIKNIPEVEIDVHDFLLITDPELKAKPRSDDQTESSLIAEVELSTENQLINISTVSVPLSSSSSTTPQPIIREEVISSTVSSSSPPETSTTPQPIQTGELISSTVSNSSPPETLASTPINVPLSSTSPVAEESLTSDSIISTSTSSLEGATTTSFDSLLFELDRLNKLNEAVAGLHTHEDYSSTTETAQAQDRTDVIDDSLDDDDDGSYDFFAELYNWLG